VAKPQLGELISVATTMGVIQGASVTDVRSWGFVVWGILALVVAIPEIAAAFGKEFVPWPGFARTVTHWQARKPWLAAFSRSVCGPRRTHHFLSVANTRMTATVPMA
jgi:hypothetical protein